MTMPKNSRGPPVRTVVAVFDESAVVVVVYSFGTLQRRYSFHEPYVPSDMVVAKCPTNVLHSDVWLAVRVKKDL